jgi:hypothetical protein
MRPCSGISIVSLAAAGTTGLGAGAACGDMGEKLQRDGGFEQLGRHQAADDLKDRLGADRGGVL